MTSRDGAGQRTDSAQVTSSSRPADRTELQRDTATPQDDTPVAAVKGDGRHIVVSVPTQSRQVTLVMLYPKVPPEVELDGGSENQ